VKISHPIRSVGELEVEVKRRDVVKTNHFLNYSMPDRPNLEVETVIDFLRDDWDDALFMAYKEFDGVSHRYNVIFDKSNKYFLIIGIGIRDKKVDLVTAFKTRKNNGDAEELVKGWG
jgi:hypothetical protein